MHYTCCLPLGRGVPQNLLHPHSGPMAAQQICMEYRNGYMWCFADDYVLACQVNGLKLEELKAHDGYTYVVMPLL